LDIVSVSAGLPRACNSPSYCYTFPDDLVSASELLGVGQSVLSLLHPSAVSIACTSALFSMRIHELLSLTSKHLISGDRIVVQAGKGSQSYIIWLPKIAEHCNLVSEVYCDGVLFPVSYSWVYRQFKRAGLSVKEAGKRNNSVTHTHRYSTARAVSGKLGAGVAGDILHHKSDKSVEYYL